MLGLRGSGEAGQAMNSRSEYDVQDPVKAERTPAAYCGLMWRKYGAR